MDVSSLKKGVAAGTVTAEQLLELLLQQMEVNRRLLARVEILEARLALYEPPPPLGGCRSKQLTQKTEK